jgi:hypothetical protein
MSKLEELVDDFDTDWYHDGQVSDIKPAQEAAVAAIKELFRELVEECDPQKGQQASEVYWGNVLRRKIEDL